MLKKSQNHTDNNPRRIGNEKRGVNYNKHSQHSSASYDFVTNSQTDSTPNFQNQIRETNIVSRSSYFKSLPDPMTLGGAGGGETKILENA